MSGERLRIILVASSNSKAVETYTQQYSTQLGIHFISLAEFKEATQKSFHEPVPEIEWSPLEIAQNKAQHYLDQILAQGMGGVIDGVVVEEAGFVAQALNELDVIGFYGIAVALVLDSKQDNFHFLAIEGEQKPVLIQKLRRAFLGV